MNQQNSLGRLKHSTKYRCNECNEGTLQLRVREKVQIIKGDNIELDEEYLYCPKCGYERDIESKIKRAKKYSKIELVEKEPERKNWKSKKPNIYNNKK